MNFTRKYAPNKIKKPSTSLQKTISAKIFLLALKNSVIVNICRRHAFFEDFICPSLINQDDRNENHGGNRHEEQSMRRGGGIINIEAEIGRNARNHDSWEERVKKCDCQAGNSERGRNKSLASLSGVRTGATGDNRGD